MQRILIIGLNGSGKSTLANKLGKILGLDVFHLDKFYYKPGWQAVEKEEWSSIVKTLLEKERWIIDGTYPSSLDRRIARSDTIIFLNFNKYRCLYRIIARSFDKVQPFDRPDGDFHKISWHLVKKVILYPKRKMLEKLENLGESKKIIILNNDREVSAYLATLVK